MTESQAVPGTEDLLNAQAARITWQELQRPFAQGRLILLSPKLDLIKTARALVKDDLKTIQQRIKSKQIETVTDDQARSWQQSNPEFWALVTPPWVLIQQSPM